VRAQASLFPFLKKKKDTTVVKEELLEAIGPLDRGAEATPEDQYRVDQVKPQGLLMLWLGLFSIQTGLEIIV
jgi:hypothetical protein